MMKPNHEDLLIINKWLQAAGDLAIRGQSDLQILQKPDKTPVTDVEQQIETLLIGNIQRVFPGDQILTEENGLIGPESEYLWLIDPIDGTKPYLRGLPFWGISLGLFRECKPLAGFILFPHLNEFYVGGDEGAFWNGKELYLSNDQVLENEMVFLAVPSSYHRRNVISYPRIQAFGSTIFHLACLVRGLAIGVITRRVNIWDFAAFLPFFPHLGLSISYTSGKALNLPALTTGEKTEEELLAAPNRFMAPLRACIQKRSDRLRGSHERDSE